MTFLVIIITLRKEYPSNTREYPINAKSNLLEIRTCRKNSSWNESLIAMTYPWVVLHKDAHYAKERNLACSSKIFKSFTKMSIKMHHNNRAHMQNLENFNNFWIKNEWTTLMRGEIELWHMSNTTQLCICKTLNPKP